MKHKTLKRLALTLCSVLFTAVFLQSKAQAVKTPLEEWSTTAGTQNFFYKNKSITDASNNVYICGATVNSAGNHDILVAKYNSSGVQQWIQQYTGSGGGDDAAQEIKVDGSGNVFITGTYYANSTDSNNVITIKYNSSGVQQWVATYNGAGSRNDAGADILLLGTDIIIGGATYSNSTDKYDFLIIKYNAAGVQQWATAWDYNNLNDAGYRLRNTAGGITLGGGAQSSSTNYQYCVAKFSASTGAYISNSVTGGNGPIGFSNVTAMVSDANDNIYITGSTVNGNYDYYTVKYNYQLVLQWSATYNGSSNLNDVANDIQVDASGNTYVTGYSTTAAQGKNIVTIKYNSAGAQQWIKSYDGFDLGEDEGCALAIGSAGQLYMTGMTMQRGNHDYYTAKYDPSNGNLLWDITYNSQANGIDKATDITTDNTGDILVTGVTNTAGSYRYATVKYKETDIITPADTTLNVGGFYYTENRGQLKTSQNTLASDVKYYMYRGTPELYFTDGSLSYAWKHADTIPSTNDTLFRIDMTFNNSLSSKIRAIDKREDYDNYFKPYLTGGRTASNYNRLVYTERWSKIDMMFASNCGGMKYYYIIKPNGAASSISWSYTGASSIAVVNNQLEIRCPWDTVIYARPVAYQIDGSGNKISLSWSPTYSLSGSTVTLSSIGTYDASKVLVIEVANPFSCSTLPFYRNARWSTFYGGSSHDELNGIATFSSGFYVTGQLMGSTYPSSNGQVVVINNPTGDVDISVSKFDLVGKMLWATYLGGSSYDQANNVTCNTIAEPIVIGHTISMDFPNTNNPLKYQQSNGGGQDAVIVKLFSTGSALKWSTCWGGTLDEEFKDVRDMGGVTYAVGYGGYNSPYKIETGAYNAATTQPSPANQQWGVIAKFDTQDSLVWATNLGSSINGIAGGGEVGLYLTGKVEWNRNFPYINNSGGYQDPDSAVTGYYDMIFARLSFTDALDWCTNMGGPLDDEGMQLAVSPQGKVYAIGTTDYGFPLMHSGSMYTDSTFGGVSDAVILRFNLNGGLQWSTYYGGNNSSIANYGEVGTDITTDLKGNVYTLVNTYSNNIPGKIYTGWNTQTYTGASNSSLIAYVSMFNTLTLAEEWTTPIQGTMTNCGNSLATYSNQALYLAGYTQNTNSFVAGNIMNIRNPYPNSTNNYYDWYNCENASPGYHDGIIYEWSISSSPTAVNEIEQNWNSLYLYPNPTSGKITIEFELQGSAEVAISIYNTLGQRIYSAMEQGGNGIRTKAIELAELAKGVYIVQVKQGDWIVSKRIVKNY
jgi:hypothetical protein